MDLGHRSALRVGLLTHLTLVEHLPSLLVIDQLVLISSTVLSRYSGLHSVLQKLISTQNLRMWPSLETGWLQVYLVKGLKVKPY